jgi:hypothetical protein
MNPETLSGNSGLSLLGFLILKIIGFKVLIRDLAISKR